MVGSLRDRGAVEDQRAAGLYGQRPADGVGVTGITEADALGRGERVVDGSGGVQAASRIGTKVLNADALAQLGLDGGGYSSRAGRIVDYLACIDGPAAIGRR